MSTFCMLNIFNVIVFIIISRCFCGDEVESKYYFNCRLLAHYLFDIPNFFYYNIDMLRHLMLLVLSSCTYIKIVFSTTLVTDLVKLINYA